VFLAGKQVYMYSNPPRVLFVEDHQDTLDLFEMMLSQLNYEVVTASNVERALRLAKDERFDIFVLDAWLSDGSGIDLCKQIREMDHTTPILFCSALAYEKDKQEALKAGAQGYLVKPVGLAAMSETVAELLSEARRKVAPFIESETTRKDSGDLVPSIVT
jgi:DNA-binding response OmpR family regulator